MSDTIYQYKRIGRDYEIVRVGAYHNATMSDYIFDYHLRCCYPIMAVKRLSDGKVLNVGDKMRNGRIITFFSYNADMVIVHDDHCGMVINHPDV